MLYKYAFIYYYMYTLLQYYLYSQQYKCITQAHKKNCNFLELTKTKIGKRICYLVNTIFSSFKKKLSPMPKSLTPTQNSKIKVTTQNTTKNFDYTAIADRLRTVSLSNGITQLVRFNQFMPSQPSDIPQKLCNQKGIHLNNCEYYSL